MCAMIHNIVECLDLLSCKISIYCILSLISVFYAFFIDINHIAVAVCDDFRFECSGNCQNKPNREKLVK